MDTTPTPQRPRLRMRGALLCFGMILLAGCATTPADGDTYLQWLEPTSASGRACAQQCRASQWRCEQRSTIPPQCSASVCYQAASCTNDYQSCFLNCGGRITNETTATHTSSLTTSERSL